MTEAEKYRIEQSVIDSYLRNLYTDKKMKEYAKKLLQQSVELGMRGNPILPEAEIPYENNSWSTKIKYKHKANKYVELTI